MTSTKLFPLAASRWLALTVSTILWPVAALSVGRCWWQMRAGASIDRSRPSAWSTAVL